MSDEPPRHWRNVLTTGSTGWRGPVRPGMEFEMSMLSPAHVKVTKVERPAGRVWYVRPGITDNEAALSEADFRRTALPFGHSLARKRHGGGLSPAQLVMLRRIGGALLPLQVGRRDRALAGTVTALGLAESTSEGHTLTNKGHLALDVGSTVGRKKRGRPKKKSKSKA